MYRDNVVQVRSRSNEQIENGKTMCRLMIPLACSNLKHSLSLQSTVGGASGINTKSASEAKAVTKARYLNQQTLN